MHTPAEAGASASTGDAAERVLAAAATLFAERGYQGTTTRAVAELAGVNEVTIFRRFTNKAGVLRALGERLAAGSAGGGSAALTATTATRDALAELARAEVRSAARHGGLTLRLAFDARSVPEIAALLGEGTGGNLAGLTAFLAERQRGGHLRDDLDPALLAEAFFAMTSSFVLGRLLLGSGPVPEGADLERLVDQLVDLYWAGAAPRTTTPGTEAPS